MYTPQSAFGGHTPVKGLIKNRANHIDSIMNNDTLIIGLYVSMNFIFFASYLSSKNTLLVSQRNRRYWTAALLLDYCVFRAELEIDNAVLFDMLPTLYLSKLFVAIEFLDFCLLF